MGPRETTTDSCSHLEPSGLQSRQEPLYTDLSTYIMTIASTAVVCKLTLQSATGVRDTCIKISPRPLPLVARTPLRPARSLSLTYQLIRITQICTSFICAITARGSSKYYVLMPTHRVLGDLCTCPSRWFDPFVTVKFLDFPAVLAWQYPFFTALTSPISTCALTTPDTCRGVPDTSSDQRMSGASSAVDADASHGSFGIIMGPPRGLGPDPNRKRKIAGEGEEGSRAEHGLPRHPSTCTSRQVCI